MRNYNYSFLRPDPELKSNLMAFGYECGDGWLPIIYRAFSKIESIIKTQYMEFPFILLQVKEKYGTLRVYYSGGNDEIEKIIDALEKESETTCEKCGNTGKLREARGWYATLCDECSER